MINTTFDCGHLTCNNRVHVRYAPNTPPIEVRKIARDLFFASCGHRFVVREEIQRERSAVHAGSAKLVMRHVKRTPNFQRYSTELPDGTQLDLWIPRNDFRFDYPTANGTNDGPPAEMVVYQSRYSKRPDPVVLDDELPTVRPKYSDFLADVPRKAVRKTTRKTTRTRSKK